jgi:hypothetical protein
MRNNVQDVLDIKIIRIMLKLVLVMREIKSSRCIVRLDLKPFPLRNRDRSDETATKDEMLLSSNSLFSDRSRISNLRNFDHTSKPAHTRKSTYEKKITK